MAENIEHTVDRSGWAPGPWDGEPDRVEWRAHGFPCLIVRAANSGALCGYVGVPPGHPFHGVDDCTEKADTLKVHGGITYGSRCAGHICHVPQPGETADVWWLGFDCAHSFDSSPKRMRMPFEGMSFLFGERHEDASGEGSEDYKTVAYVTAEVEKLAEQLAAVSR